MRKLFAQINPFVRGLLVIAAVALVVVVLQLYQTLAALFLIAKIAFPLAIAFFVYLMWRERRSDIATWPDRLRAVLYAGVAVIVADFLLLTYLSLVGDGLAGFDALAFVLTLGLSGFAIYRAWRDAHTYG